MSVDRVVDLTMRIGQWADQNFDTHDNPNLHRLLPFLGIIEELGEADSDDPEAVKDAVADATIYALDLIYRLNLGQKEQVRQVLQIVLDIPRSDVLVFNETYAKRPEAGLARAFLKRSQGIRGFDQDEKFQKTIVICLACLFHQLQDRVLDVDLWDLTESVFNEIVSRRNWQLNPETGSTTE